MITLFMSTSKFTSIKKYRLEKDGAYICFNNFRELNFKRKPKKKYGLTAANLSYYEFMKSYPSYEVFIERVKDDFPEEFI